LVKLFIESLNPSKEFIKKFPKLQIATKPKSGFVNYEYDLTKKEFYEIDEVNTYEHIVFTRDSSLKCGDTVHLDENKRKNPKEKLYGKFESESFHCEIITPILNDISDLKILYQNLFDRLCFRNNSSTALHINISMVSKDKQIPIYWSQGFIDCFLDTYEEYEKENYKIFRPNGSIYAKEISNYAKNYTYKDIQRILPYETKEYINENFTEGEKFYKCFIDLSEKYNSFHIKNPVIGEFRLFPSEDNYEQILKYVFDTYEIIEEAINDYYKHHKIVIDELQEKYLKLEVDYSDLEYYNDFLYYTNGSKISKLSSMTNLDKALEFLFESRGQEIVNINKINDKNIEVFCMNKLTKEQRTYKVKYLDNKKFKIKVKTQV